MDYKKWLGVGLLLLVTVLPSQAVTYFHSSGYCAAPDRQTVTQGVKSSGVVKTADVAPYTPTGAVLAIYPSCTVNVYIQGTLLPPVGGLFSDRNGTPLSNPFTGTSTGVVSFYVFTAGSYDIVLSGTVSPVFTYSDVSVGSAGGGNGGTGDASSLQGTPVSTTAPVLGNLFEFDGSNWTPFAPIWCQLTGCTLTGPLVLSGDPASGLQAATKNYVDNLTAGKASLVGGLVPTNQLGSGTADGTKVLKGDHTWGTSGGAGVGSCQPGFVRSVNAGAPGCSLVTDADADSTLLKTSQVGVANGVPALDSNQDVTAPHDVNVAHKVNVIGPFYQTTPIPITPMACPPIGQSALGVDNDGDYKKCINGAAVVPFSGTATGINGAAAATTLNLNGTTPVAQAGNEDCTYQISGINVSVQCPSLVISTGGQGGLYLPFDTPVTPTLGAGTVISSAPNLMSFVQFTINEKVVIGHFNASVTALSAAQTFTVAIYTSDGLTKLVDMGAVSCAATGVKAVTIGSPVTLTRGVYLMAWGASDAVCAATMLSSGPVLTMMNQSTAKRLGTAANPYAAGPPATLGALTNLQTAIMLAYIEP